MMQTMRRKGTISSEAASKAVSAAVEKGLGLGCRVAVAVVDDGGNLVAFQRTDGAYLPSTSLAQDKAYTAAGFGIPTAHLYQHVKESPLLLETLVGRERLVFLAGGLPIVVEGEVVGAIGCSGGNEEQDATCAVAGLAAIGIH